MSNGPIEFNFGCEIDDRGRPLQTTPMPVTTVQTTVSVPTPAVAPRLVKPAPEPVLVAAPRPPTPKDIVKLAKDRLEEVNAELEKMKALVKERDELQRLVAAADGAPKSAPKPKTKSKTPKQ